MHPLCLVVWTQPMLSKTPARMQTMEAATLNPTCVEPSFDGYSYSVMEIGDQCWFAENLRSTIYRNGDVIPSVTEDGWESATIGFSA